MTKEPNLAKQDPDQPDQSLMRALKKRSGVAADGWLSRNRSLVLRQTPVWAQSLTLVLISIGGLAIAGSVLFKIDEVVTVTGQLEAVTGSTEVKSPVGGKVSEVFYKDGQSVEKGQLLLRFDTRQALSDRSTYQSLIDIEQKDLIDRIKILESRRDVIQKKLDTTESIVSALKDLVGSGGFQRVQYLEQLDKLYELKSQLANINLDLNRTQLEAQKSLSEMRNRLSQVELQLQYQNVKAPVSGVVFNPKAGALSVIPAGDVILTLVPQQSFKASVFVPNKDIGFVKTGQKAQVRVDAFPYTRYGELTGKVLQIGADALPPDEQQNYYRFPVKLSLNRSYLLSQGVKIPLRSGMAITANLKLREKRVISLVSDLFVNQLDSIKSLRGGG